MKNTKLLILLLTAVAALGIYFLVIKKPAGEEVVEDPKSSLPINTIPVSERPFVTLTPDSSGRNLTLTMDRAPESLIEYELVYDTSETQEGAFGRVNLEGETQPVEKELLLGSRSAGGAVTHHEGVTGGSLTLTYDEIRLKESFAFLRFDADEESYSSIDARLEAVFSTGSLRAGNVIVIMKSFGLPEDLDGEIAAGPYTVQTALGVAPEEVRIKLGSAEGTHVLYEHTDDGWVEVESTVEDGVLIAEDLSGLTYVVILE